MSDTKFRLVFSGEIAEGADMASVKANVRNLLKTDDARVERMFSSGSTILKNDIDHETAIKYKAIFDKSGAVSTIEAMGVAAPPPATQTASQTICEEVSCPTCGLRQRQTAVCRTCGYPIEKPAEKSPENPPAKVIKESISCPKCNMEQEKSPTCISCGVIFEKIANRTEREQPVIPVVGSQVVLNKQPDKKQNIEPVTDINPYLVTGNLTLPGTRGYFVAALIVFIVGCCSLTYSAVKLAKTYHFVKTSHSATGKVIGFASSRSSGGSSDGTTYAPEVDFRAPDGRLIRFRSGTYCNIQFHDIGDDIGVRFDPSNPYNAEIDSFLPIWGLGVLTLLLGIFLPWGALSMFKADQRVKAFNMTHNPNGKHFSDNLIYCPKCYVQQPPSEVCICCHANLATLQNRSKRWQSILFAASGKVRGANLSGKDMKIKYAIQLVIFLLIASSFAWQAKSMFSTVHTFNSKKKESPIDWRDSRNKIALILPGDWRFNSTKQSKIDPMLLNQRNDRYFLIISPRAGEKTYVAYGAPGFSLDHFKSAGWDSIVAEIAQGNRVKFSDVVQFNGLTVYRVGYDIPEGYREDAFIEGAKEMVVVCFVVPNTAEIDEQATRIRNMLATNLTAI